ncbi:MAG: ferlin [Peptoniphilus sp.]|nr:ferlin [Peptoniphilus sp.]
MKRHLLIVLMSLTLILSACGKDQNQEQPTEKNTAEKGTVTILDDEDTQGDTGENSGDNTEENVADDEITNNELTEEEENANPSTDKETLNNLIENSDYISRVRIQMSPENNTTSTFIEDYRGDLSSIELTLPKNLLANREYIIFYLDGAEGKIEPTRGGESFIEIGSDNDAALKHIEEIFNITKTPSMNN